MSKGKEEKIPAQRVITIPAEPIKRKGSTRAAAAEQLILQGEKKKTRYI